MSLAEYLQDHPGTRLKDHTGERFGRLTAVEPVGSTKSRGAVWHLVCECGLIVERSIPSLRATIWMGYSPSCGSTTCSGRFLGYGRAARNSVVNSYRKNAQRLGREFSLTDVELDVLLTSNCYYCGASPSAVRYSNQPKSGEFLWNGIDRVDSARGYCTGNVVSCCWKCNRAKGDMSQSEFLEWIKAAYEHFH